MSTTIIELREPFRSFFNQLDQQHVTFCPSSGKLEVGGFPLARFPQLDADEAIALAAELEAALQPVLARYRNKKLAEVVDMMKGQARPVEHLVVR